MQKLEINGNAVSVRNKTELFRALIQELAGDTRISFEGDFRALHILSLPGVSSCEETAVLKRNTVWSKKDFAVAPLTETAQEVVIQAIGGSVPKKLLHIQIERAGVLEFGAYDSFQSLFFGPGLSHDFVNTLIARGILTT